MKPKKGDAVSPVPRNNDYQAEYCKWFLTLALSILAFVIVAGIVPRICHPDVSHALQFARETVVRWGLPVAPEPMNQILYLAALVVFAITIPGFYFLAGRWVKGIKTGSARILCQASQVISIIAVLLVVMRAFAAPNPCAITMQSSYDVLAKTNTDFYFRGTFLYDNFMWYILILFPAVLLYLVYKKKIPSPVEKIIARVGPILVYVFCGALIVAMPIILSFKFPSSPENKYDFNNVFYSVAQVYQGVPMLVDHFTNSYGLYPHFITPVMKLFGLSVLTFSTIMGVLVGFCFVFLLIVLLRTVSSKSLVLLGFTGAFFLPYGFGLATTDCIDPYFGMNPIRWIVPFSLLAYAVWYLQKRSKTLYFLSFPLFALGILWCPDFGMVTFVSLAAFYMFLEGERRDPKTIAKRILLHGAAAAAGMIVAFAGYALVIKIAYGKVPDLMVLFSTIKVEGVIGRGALPMPATIHPWMLVAGIYLLGLLYAVHHLFTGKKSARSALVFLLSVIGIGCFAYYLRRSHNWNLFACSPWCFPILAIFADHLLPVVRQRKILLAPFALLIFMLSFSFFQTAWACPQFVNLAGKDLFKEKNRAEEGRILRNADFVRNQTREKERVMIFSTDSYQGLYYALSNTAAAVNPGQEDLRLISDYERILSFLVANRSARIFFDPLTFGFCDGRIPTILSSSYDVSGVAEPRGDFMLLGRKKATSCSDIFDPGDRSALHENFDRNLDDKLLFAEGKKGPLSLGDQFSVQVLFKPDKIMPTNSTIWQTVFCNRNGNAGLMLMERKDNPQQYFLTIGAESINCPVDVAAWNCIAFEVNKTRVRLFKNGKLISVADVHTTYQNSEMPLYIGSYNEQGGYFWGDIREIEITKGLLNDREVQATWESAAKILDIKS